MHLLRSLKRTAGAAAIASAVSFACCRPALELPNDACNMKHQCEIACIGGGLNTNSYVVLQTHDDTIEHTFNTDSLTSQLFQYHLLQDLVNNFNVKTIFFEGVYSSETLEAHEKMDETDPDLRQKGFAGFIRCVEETKARFTKDSPALLLRGKAAEDECIASDLRIEQAYIHFLLRMGYPSINMVGAENREAYDAEIGYIFLMDELAKLKAAGKNVEDTLNNDPALLERVQKLHDAKNKFKGIDRGRYAIEATLTRLSENTAVVMGSAHRDAMMERVKEEPVWKRGSYHFIKPRCQESADFHISEEIVREALKDPKHAHDGFVKLELEQMKKQMIDAKASKNPMRDLVEARADEGFQNARNEMKKCRKSKDERCVSEISDYASQVAKFFVKMCIGLEDIACASDAIDKISSVAKELGIPKICNEIPDAANRNRCIDQAR